MLHHGDTSTSALDRPPVASHVGPFPRRPFLEVWWRHRPSGPPWLIETDAFLLPLVETSGRLEIAGEAAISPGAKTTRLFVGGRSDGFANFEGKIDEVAVYDRALRPEEIAAHYAAASASAKTNPGSFDVRP